MLTSEIMKKEVLDVNANRAGSVVDVDIDVNSGTINHFILKTGARRKVKLMPGEIETIGQKVVLNTSKETLERSQVGIR